MIREWTHALVWQQRHRRGQMVVPELPLLRQWIASDDLLVDVGAHAGSWCYPMSRWVPRGEVLAFEALPYYATSLRHLMTLGRRNNVTVVNAAVTAKPHTVRMVWQNPAGRRIKGLTHIAGEGESDAGTVDVPGVSLDDQLAKKTRRLRFLKCDVEGAELGVFLGGSNSIGRWRPIIFTELVAEYLARYQHSVSDVFEFFRKLDYVAWETDGARLSRLVTKATDYKAHDLLLVPQELGIR